MTSLNGCFISMEGMLVQRVLISFLLFNSILVFGLPPVLSQEEQTIQIKGSDTMVNLGQAWAEAFMEEYPAAFIAVTGGGSGTGIAALMNGTCTIAQSSRNMSPQELELAKSKGLNIQEIKAAVDALVFAVHPNNPVRSLNTSRLSDVFTGKVQNWKELGGNDEPILSLSRERNSGTHIYVLEEVVRKGNKKGPEEFAPSVLMLPSSQAIEQEIAGNQAAIGYFGMGYLSDKVKALAIFNEGRGAFQEPTVDHALDGSYPLSRALYFYLPREPQGTVKQFIDFVLSKRGQDIVLQMDFVPLQKSGE